VLQEGVAVASCRLLVLEFELFVLGVTNLPNEIET
jgi:hypothetical protein